MKVVVIGGIFASTIFPKVVIVSMAGKHVSPKCIESKLDQRPDNKKNVQSPFQHNHLNYSANAFADECVTMMSLGKNKFQGPIVQLSLV